MYRRQLLSSTELEPRHKWPLHQYKENIIEKKQFPSDYEACSLSNLYSSELQRQLELARAMFSTDCKLWFSPANRDLIDTSPLIRFQWGSGLDDMAGSKDCGAAVERGHLNLHLCQPLESVFLCSNASPQWWSWGATRRPNVSQILSHAPWAPWPLWACEGRTQVVAISPSPSLDLLLFYLLLAPSFIFPVI